MRWDDDADAAADETTGEDRTPPGAPGACAGCPVGSVMAAFEGASPGATEHLLNAAQEMVRAARAVLDAADEVIEQQRAARAERPSESRVRRIDIA